MESNVSLGAVHTHTHTSSILKEENNYKTHRNLYA